MPGKPGELVGGRADNHAAGSAEKTTQLKNNSGGIEKGVVVGTVYLYFLVPPGHYATAGPAKDGFQRFKGRFLLLFCRRPILPIRASFPKKDLCPIYRLHSMRRWPLSLPEWYAVPVEYRPEVRCR